MKRVYPFFLCILLPVIGYSQMLQGKIVDADTKEPLSNATITSKEKTFFSKPDGTFILPGDIKDFEVSASGYLTVKATSSNLHIALQRNDNQLEEVVVSASKTIQKRTEAPVAISIINKQLLEDTKAQRLDFLLNKVSGVFMVNLGNEQHEMSIRQPITTKSLFLYLEDGIPIRTTGVYNHNALLEMNLPAAKSVEVIKGPSSALYGGEAIGGAVNIITQPSPLYTCGSVSAELNNTGYKRADFQLGTATGKWGFIASGYYADKHNGPIEYSDFSKKAVTIRTDYRADDRTAWTNTLTLVDYYSDMTGTVDSIKFAKKDYSSQQTFTYRKVYALRYKSMLSKEWSKNSETNISLLYRNNTVEQNPSYTIAATSNPLKFKSQVNQNAFNTYALFAAHTQKVGFLNSRLIAGLSMEYSPQQYYAKFISVNRDTVSGKFAGYDMPMPDSFLSNYKTGIVNMASYITCDFTPLKNMHIVMSLRYDGFQYYFINSLPLSASVSTASTVNYFSRVTPKLGFTYNYKNIGFYTNYSQGYVPPQLTELYSSVKEAPYLLPQVFNNYEIGGWVGIAKKLYCDWSLYYMNGKNEIISVRQADNSYINENAGVTSHTGIEYGITVWPANDLQIRFSGTNAQHRFTRYISKGIDYSDKEMSGAPRFIANAEITCKPHFIKGFRISAEWQHQGKYFMDDLDQYTYKGFDILNFRSGYTIKSLELWINLLNATNKYYSVFSSKNSASNGTAAYAYNLGDPREITIGLKYSFGK